MLDAILACKDASVLADPRPDLPPRALRCAAVVLGLVDVFLQFSLDALADAA